MLVIKNSAAREPFAAALGYFDGFHRGHAALAKTALDEAKKLGVAPAAATFSFGANRLKTKGPRSLMTDDQRRRALGDAGFEFCLCSDFSDIRGLTAREYIEDYLKGAAAFCFGTDYTCGSDLADAETVRRMAESMGIECVVVEKLRENGEEISSTAIKKLLLAGEAEKAALLLGRPYELEAEVLHGDGRGRILGFPTVNQRPSTLMPKNGVYVSAAVIGDREYPSLTNIGVRPTFGGDPEPSAETWIDGYDGEELYGKTLDIRLKRFLRDERRFSGAAELEAQLRTDITDAFGR